MIRDGDHFTWRGATLPYFVHRYNRTAENERAIEVPIARHFIDQQTGVGLEVGNVLSHYGPVDHRIVDLYEEAPGVDNVDLFEVHDRFDWIVAISTLEHVWWELDGPGRTRWEDEPHPEGPMAALAHLRRRLLPGGRLLITAPFGQHPYFDGAILGSGLEASRFGTFTFDGGQPMEQRASGGRDWNYWSEHPNRIVWRPARELRWAGAVWVATWENQR
jgi:SAM-dependent methyltransferase